MSKRSILSHLAIQFLGVALASLVVPTAAMSACRADIAGHIVGTPVFNVNNLAHLKYFHFELYEYSTQNGSSLELKSVIQNSDVPDVPNAKQTLPIEFLIKLRSTKDCPKKVILIVDYDTRSDEKLKFVSDDRLSGFYQIIPGKYTSMPVWLWPSGTDF